MAHINKASDKASHDALNDALNESERLIVELIKANPSISQECMAERTGFSRSKVQRIMKKLSEDHVIYREGARKNGFWRISGE